ncbi:MAG: PepSY-associated TM helix domain-containing protein [Vicinamibacterales bacterium]
MRRALFQVHLWVGVLTGAYIFVVSLTGAALVFRIDLQRALYPPLFTPKAQGALADPVMVMESVSRAYPGDALSGVEAPTGARPTYLAYVTRGPEFLTILIDPVSAEVLGGLPVRTLLRTVQELHFNLLLGRNGRIVNGLGASCALLMCLTGAVLWWQSRRNWRRVVWEAHRTIGAWSVVFIAMWAVTGLSLAFPREFRSAVGWLSPITASPTPQSSARAKALALQGSSGWRAQIEAARRAKPGLPVARVVLPFNDRAAFVVMFATASPTPAGETLAPVYLDQFTGQVIDEARAPHTMGDRLMSWMVPLHVGDFSSRALKTLWFLMGLTPAILFVSGFVIWLKQVRA